MPHFEARLMTNNNKDLVLLPAFVGRIVNPHWHTNKRGRRIVWTVTTKTREPWSFPRGYWKFSSRGLASCFSRSFFPLKKCFAHPLRPSHCTLLSWAILFFHIFQTPSFFSRSALHSTRTLASSLEFSWTFFISIFQKYAEKTQENGRKE